MSEQPSGRELSALIAERVFGEPMPPPPVREECRFYMSHTELSPKGQWEHIHVEEHGDECEWEPLAFSESIEAAMRVVDAVIPQLPDNEVIKNLGFAQVRMFRYANGMWNVAFTKKGGKSATGNSLQEAICLAALAAIESKE